MKESSLYIIIVKSHKICANLKEEFLKLRNQKEAQKTSRVPKGKGRSKVIDS